MHHPSHSPFHVCQVPSKKAGPPGLENESGSWAAAGGVRVGADTQGGPAAAHGGSLPFAASERAYKGAS